MRFHYGSTITVLRDTPGALSADGDKTVTTTRTDIAGCAVAPVKSTETIVLGRDGLAIDLTVFAPYGSDILFTDRIEIAGIPYAIDGTPFNWQSVFTGKKFGMEIHLQRRTG